MANTYLDLSNEVLRELNEVVLTSGTFESATGIQAFVKDAINKSIFELEKIIYQKKIESNHIKFEKHIFISGLPRSGSTGILNLLYDTSEFASLTYQNMPFILAPNLSKLFIRKVF